MDDELRAKTDEMLEILLERDLREFPELKAFIMDQSRAEIEEQVRAFYAEHGEWPAFRRDPYGGALTIGTQAEIDQLPPPSPPPPPRPPVSEEARRILREDKELRDAIRHVQFPPTRLVGMEGWAKEAGITAEEFIEREIDGFIDSDWGECFQFFRDKRGRYPEHGEKDEAANLYNDDWRRRWKLDETGRNWTQA